jgi:hypothetical protein
MRVSVEISCFLTTEDIEKRSQYESNATYFLNVVSGSFLPYPLDKDCKMADAMYLCNRQRVVTEFLSAAGSSPMDSEMYAKHVC